MYEMIWGQLLNHDCDMNIYKMFQGQGTGTLEMVTRS